MLGEGTRERFIAQHHALVVLNLDTFATLAEGLTTCETDDVDPMADDVVAVVRDGHRCTPDTISTSATKKATQRRPPTRKPMAQPRLGASGSSEGIVNVHRRVIPIVGP